MMQELQNVIIANALILIIPGLNFSVIVRNALLYGVSAANWTAVGITTAIMVHVILAVFSLSLILDKYPWLFDTIKYFGCIYILYLGCRFLYLSFSTEKSKEKQDNFVKSNFKTGFMIDILNPFVSMFYLSIFAPLIAQGNTIKELWIFFLSILILTLAWFLIVGTFFSKNIIRNIFRQYQNWIQRISGFAMFYFAYQLFISKM